MLTRQSHCQRCEEWMQISVEITVLSSCVKSTSDYADLHTSYS